MEWQQFVMKLESLDADRVEAALLASGALSVTLTDAGDEPVLEPAPGETPLWNDTRVTALFDGNINLDNLGAKLQAELGVTSLPPCHVETLADRAWEREWLKDFQPMPFGERLWVVPGDMAAPGHADSVVVRLDPGLAFGTGTHATTALCLEWLDGLDLRGASVYDVGCGSGILGIAALKLGASDVLGVDIDLQAITATRQNAVRNGVADCLEASDDVTTPDRQFDVVLANILAGTLIDNADRIGSAVRVGGRLALSGILANQVADVKAAFCDGFDFDPPVTRHEWALLAGTRN